MEKMRCKNKFQKAAHRVGEVRVDRHEIAELLELSRSENSKDREVAAELLCPCHVRKRIEEVWEALYRMLEDPDARVRRAAWHTLEDGGRPDDPKLDEILDRVLKNDTDRQVRNFAQSVAGPRKDKELAYIKAAGHVQKKQRGKCDFCGKTNVFVDRDLDTMIPSGGDTRAAWVCEECANQ
jgi:hypothetical protein